MQLKVWHYYKVHVPYFENGRWKSKVRPCVLYQFSGADCVFIPLTTNQDGRGFQIKEPNEFEVEVQLNGIFNIIKVNKPITLSQNTITNPNVPVIVSSKTRRTIIAIWENTLLYVKK